MLQFEKLWNIIHNIHNFYQQHEGEDIIMPNVNIEVLGLIVAFAAMIASVVMSILALYKSNQAIREKRRPEFDVAGLAIDYSKLEVYTGTTSVIPESKRKDYAMLRNELEKTDYKELTKKKNSESNMAFHYKNDKHWLINFIPKKGSRRTRQNLIDESIVIGFNALEVDLDFSKKTIREIELIQAYTVGTDHEVISSKTRLNAKFLLNQEQTNNGKLTIPFTYVSLSNHPKAKLLERKILLLDKYNAEDLATATETSETLTEESSRIDILTDENPIRWLGFVETGYVLRLTTTSNYSFDYSFVITVKDKKCNVHPISSDSKFFQQMAKSAKRRIGKRGCIVQRRFPRWMFWRR